ncbi:MAG: response regulator transcription factor [Anaerolineales bacterium]|nr:response regulator transcription factor [Anaerolineales bacterium]
MTETLLLIEDDVTLCEALRFMLTKKGFQVEVANNAITGLQKAYAVKPDAIILDIMLPDMDGWQTCARFREMSDVPIIMLTALGSEENVVKGLNLGADDYIIKPVTAEELSARVRALLRRVTRSNGPGSNGPTGNSRGPIFTYENLVIDFDKHEVTVDTKRVDLSPTEFRLLSVLVRHKGRMLPHEFLLTEVWGPEYVGEIDYLRLYISYLRRKVEKDPSKPSLIHNEWGVGYRFG